MRLSIGARLGLYEITGILGKGAWEAPAVPTFTRTVATRDGSLSAAAMIDTEPSPHP